MVCKELPPFIWSSKQSRKEDKAVISIHNSQTRKPRLREEKRPTEDSNTTLY